MLTATAAGAKAFTRVGRVSSVALAAAVLTTPSALVKAPAARVLVAAKAPDTVTLVEKVQVAFAGTAPPDWAKPVAPAVSDAGPNPVQPPATVTAPPVAVSPPGNESVNEAPVSAVGLGLVTVMVSTDVPPATALGGLNDLLTLAGCRTVTSSAAELAGS